MGCFPGIFKRENGPLRHSGKRPIFGHAAVVENATPQKGPPRAKIGTKKNMTARDMTGFCAVFSAPEIREFYPHVGAISLPKLNTQNLEKEEQKNPLENIQTKSSGESSPKL